MEAQLTVRIPEDLKRALDEASRKMHRKSSDIVRLALRAFLQGDQEPGTRPVDRVRGLLGSLESGLPHLAERHRKYVIESLKNGG
jgi:hypothetical protein